MLEFWSNVRLNNGDCVTHLLLTSLARSWQFIQFIQSQFFEPLRKKKNRFEKSECLTSNQQWHWSVSTEERKLHGARVFGRLGKPDSVSHFMVEIFWQPFSSLYITTASTLIQFSWREFLVISLLSCFIGFVISVQSWELWLWRKIKPAILSSLGVNY